MEEWILQQLKFLSTMRLFVQGVFFFKMTIQLISCSFFSISPLRRKLEQKKEQFLQKTFKTSKFFRCFFAPDFLAQNSTRTVCSLSAPEKKVLYLLNVSSIGNRKKRTGYQVVYSLLLNYDMLVFFYILTKLALIEIRVTM